MTPEPYFRVRLKQELEQRSRRNPRYSLRAFAASLGRDISYLSRILSGQRLPSILAAKEFADKLSLAGKERKEFLTSVSRAKVDAGVERAGATGSIDGKPAVQVPNEMYEVLADIHHWAILELTDVKGFRSSPQWIAKELGISVLETRLALERLCRVGLLRLEKGRYRQTHAATTTGDKSSTSAALKRHQQQILEKAAWSLAHDPLESRSMNGMTIAIDPAKVPLAKRMIEEFIEQLGETLETGVRQRVYQIGIAFFPLQRESRDHE